MGSLTHKLALSKKDVCVSGGFSTKSQGDAFTSISQVNTPIDVIIDFSSPSATDKLTELCKKSHCALLVASTGHNKEQLDQINSLSTRHPITCSICKFLSRQ